MNAIDYNDETKNEKTPFKRWNINRVAKKNFTENPTIRVSGKNISLKEYTNENAIDTNIYEVLEKYNGDLKMTQEKMNKHYQAISNEMAHINNLADATKIMDESKKVWNSLPLEMRKQFNNNIGTFAKNGQKYAQQKINEYNKMVEKIKLENEAKFNKSTEVKGEIND